VLFCFVDRLLFASHNGVAIAVAITLNTVDVFAVGNRIAVDAVAVNAIAVVVDATVDVIFDTVVVDAVAVDAIAAAVAFAASQFFCRCRY